MPKQPDGPLTKDVLVEETRFLLKTLLRDDLFGEEVSLTEAEKLLESSLSLGFVDYATFLKKRDYVVIDRTRNTVRVTPKGRLIADGMDDAEFHRELGAHFQTRLAVTPMAPAGSSLTPRSPTASRLPSPTLSTPPNTTSGEDLRDGRYTRQEALGQGGLGTVYRGRNIYLNRDVAIKEYRHLFEYLHYLQRDDVLRRLRAAVMAHGALQNPFILEVLDLNFDKDPPYVILNLASGGNLKERLLRARTSPGGVLPFPVATRALFQLAYALHHAHTRNVIHADLKPENVLFDAAGNVKVSDFGVARVVEKRPGEGPPVYMGVGNPSYLAPEQLHGSSDITPASDVYAYGILLYQILTGALPGRRSPMPSEVNKAVPAQLDNLFDAMTRDRVEERLQTMDAVLDGLYQAFPKEEVLSRGTLVLFDVDPFPPSAKAEATSLPPVPAAAAADVTQPSVIPLAGNGASTKPEAGV